ncbi:MAG: hypothetical protein KZQ58_10495 [gamma proteobacterium symbiont of Bathyaustriella thionipta]|nr:hypothetical protein [gamma proteobacterium symbiont of Bathyaustriella thionipta]
MKIFIQIAAVMAASLMAWLFIEFMFVRSGQNHSSIWSSGWLVYTLFAIVPATLYFIFLPAFKHKSAAGQYLLPLVISALLTSLWLLIALPIVINFHLYIGGTL